MVATVLRRLTTSVWRMGGLVSRWDRVRLTVKTPNHLDIETGVYEMNGTPTGESRL